MLKTTTSVINTSQIAGVLPVANGGTGVTTSTGTGSTVLSTTPIFMGDVTLSTGNLIVSDGKGIDFSATPGTGTNELLNDYEEGTWTPTDASGAGLIFSGFNATYTKIGRQVICNLFMSYPVTASTATAVIAGLPFAAGSFGPCTIQGVFSVRNSSFTSYGVNGAGGASSFNFDKNSGTANATNSDLSNTFFALTITYQT